MRLSLSVLDVPAARRFFYDNQGSSFVLFYRERGDGEGEPEEELELFRSPQASLDLAELSFEVVKHIQGITQTA